MEFDTYKNVMDKTVASHTSKQASKDLFDTVKYAGTEIVATPSKKKHSKTKFIAMLAASFAIVFALGAVITTNNIPLTNKSCGFILSVNAAEITQTPLVIPNDTVGRSLSNFSYAVNFPVTCSGVNIERVTYSIENAIFITESKNITEAMPYGKEINVPGVNFSEYGNLVPANAYSSYTIEYNKQDDPEIYCPRIAGSTDLIKDGETVIEWTTKIFSEDLSEDEELNLEKQIMDKYFEDVVVTVKVNYTNGTTESQKLKLGTQIGDYYDTKALFITYTLVG